MKRFLRPPLYILIPLDFLAAVMLTCSFLYPEMFTILCYPVYKLSAGKAHAPWPWMKGGNE